MRETIVNTAKSFLGYNEADGSYKEIISLYNSITPLPVSYRLKLSDEWCAGFVSAVAKKAGITDIVFPECSCERMIGLYKKAGRWQEKDGHSPLPGDIIFYDWQDTGSGDNKGHSDHVGIVVSANGKSMKIIEGNLSCKVAYRTMAVNARYIRGYGLPNYPEGTNMSSNDKAATELPGASESVLCSVSLPQLSKGSKGISVKAMQRLLIGCGFSCGSCGADGDFGNGTLTALKSFQKAKALTVDGICGAKSWTRLLRG